jgi:hypothetical protein
MLWTTLSGASREKIRGKIFNSPDQMNSEAQKGNQTDYANLDEKTVLTQ